MVRSVSACTTREERLVGEVRPLSEAELREWDWIAERRAELIRAGLPQYKPNRQAHREARERREERSGA